MMFLISKVEITDDDDVDDVFLEFVQPAKQKSHSFMSVTSSVLTKSWM